MARILHRGKYVILVGQRDHHLLDVGVLEHVQVGGRHHVGVQPGQASHLPPLELLLEHNLVLISARLLPPPVPRQVGVGIGIPRLEDPVIVLGREDVPVHNLAMATPCDDPGVSEVTMLNSKWISTLKAVNFCTEWVFFPYWDRDVKVWVL